jgi:hypothetical protein
MVTEELIRSLSSGLQPVRRLRGVESRIVLWAGFGLLCVSIGTIGFGVRADLVSKIRNPTYFGGSVLLFVIFILSARRAFHLSVPGAERAALDRALPIGALLVWAGLIAAGGWSDQLAPTAASSRGWPCVLRMICLAFAPTVAALLMLRRAAPLRSGWTGWFTLLSAASLAILGTQMVCATDEPRHLFLWHFGPLLVAAVMGIHLGRWALARPGGAEESAQRSSAPSR